MLAQSLNQTNNLTFQEEQFKLFLYEDAKSINTQKSYIFDLTIFFKWLNENYTDQSILTRSIVLHYKQYLSSINNKAETINRKLNSLKKYNEYLINTNQQENIVIIPKDKIKIQMTAISPTDIVERDINKFLEQIKKNESVRDYTIVYLMLFTGLRISEALGVKLTNINFKTCKLTIIGKGSKQRKIDLNSKVVKVIKEYLAIRDIYKYAEESEYLFVSQKSEIMNRQSINNIFYKYTHIISPHKLRHYFATYALNNGFSLHEVASIMGHSSIQTTQIYLNTNEKEMKSKMERL